MFFDVFVCCICGFAISLFDCLIACFHPFFLFFILNIFLCGGKLIAIVKYIEDLLFEYFCMYFDSNTHGLKIRALDTHSPLSATDNSIGCVTSPKLVSGGFESPRS